MRKSKKLSYPTIKACMQQNWKNVDEMDNFLDRYQPQKFNQDQINYLNVLITPKEIEVVIDSLPTKKKHRTRWF